MTVSTTATKPNGATDGAVVKLDKKLADTSRAIEEIASRYAVAAETGNRFERAFVLAQAMGELRRCISAECLAAVMALQGSALGFKTDKDRDGGYPADTVKEALIEAVLRGAYPVNNEFNIISGRAYLTKECYERLVRSLPGVDNVRLRPGVPAMAAGGALVPYTVTCTFKGRAVKLERIARKMPDGTVSDERIPVKVNSSMGADAIIGKATRKMLKYTYEFLTGNKHNDPEDIEDVTVHATGELIEPPSRTDAVAQQLQQQAAQRGLPTPDATVPAEKGKPRKASAAQLSRIVDAAKALEWGDADVDEAISVYGVQGVADLNVGQADELIGRLHDLVERKQQETA